MSNSEANEKFFQEELQELLKVITERFIEAGFLMPERNYTDQTVFLRDVVRALIDAKRIRGDRDSLLRERQGEVWFWTTGDPEDGDNVDTITCPILIQPEDLQTILNQAKANLHLAGEIDKARDEILNTPIPMVLHCPRCGLGHIDEPDPRIEELGVLRKLQTQSSLGDRPPSIAADKLKRLIELEEIESTLWTNPPHKSHLCFLCKCIWRPADVPTVGVESVATRGEKDTWP